MRKIYLLLILTTIVLIVSYGCSLFTDKTKDSFSSNSTTSTTTTTGTTTTTTTTSLPNSKEITDFKFESSKNLSLGKDYTANISGTNITIAIPFYPRLSSMIATFTTTGKSVDIGGTVQTSGVTQNIFSSGNKNYTVTADDNSKSNYTLTIAPYFVDGNGTNGINKNVSNNVGSPMVAEFNSKMYAAWNEKNGSSIYQIRIAKYNGNDSSPAWTFVDGNGANGINKNVSNNAYGPKLIVCNSGLYVLWGENDGSVNQIRVAKYNGNDSAPVWSFVDGNSSKGINYNPTYSTFDPCIAVFKSDLYATWTEDNGTKSQIRVIKYNGNDSSPAWTFIDGNGVNGINHNSSNNAFRAHLAELNSKLYVIWDEQNGSNTYQIRASVYNGNDSAPIWFSVDGKGTNGINKNTGYNAFNPQLIEFNSKLYVIWNESNGTANQIRVVRYNGNDSSPTWTFVDGNGTNGINKNPLYVADYAQLTVFDSSLCTIWREQNSSSVSQVRAAKYNGNDSAPVWTFIDGNGVNGINKNTSYSFGYPQFTVFNSSLYAIWNEEISTGAPAQIRVMLLN